MVETITEADTGSEVEALHQLATVVLNEHTNDHGLCAVCGCAFPCGACRGGMPDKAAVAAHHAAQKH